MKKIIAMLLCVCMLFALTACGSSSEAPADAYVSESVKGLAVEIAQAAGAICERCWIHSETLDENGLCPRCARVMATKAE